MPSFEGTKNIYLQPTETNVPIEFDLPIVSAEGANDGVIPYGDTISAVTVKVYDSAGADKTSEILSASSFSGTVVTVELDYPSTSGAGTYKLTFQITTTNGAHLEYDAERIVAVDL